MSKYIIEIEDEPFVRLSALFGEEGLYRAKGFNSLVFDQFGLDKLTPLDKELDEAYQKGLSQGYKDGYEEGLNDTNTLEYHHGLDDAWECMKAIAFLNKPRDMRDFFGCSTLGDVLIDYTASEAIEKLKAYEEQQKADEIKVGDEVIPIDAIRRPFVVVSIENNVINGFDLANGYTPRGCHRDETNWEKTGRHFPQVAELVKAMKGGAE